jgi:peptidyl-dipeptidase Dcp
MTDNPLLETWTAPFNLPPFDRIRPEHFPRAFDRAMAEEAAEIAAIAHSAEVPGFANTIEALERSGRLLDRVTRVFSNLEASAGDEALDAIARAYMPKLAEHRTKIALDPDLFARIAELYEKREALGLAADQLRLLERHHLRFVRAGALLGPLEKARIAAINERLAELHTRFSQNVVHDEKDWHLPLDAGDLEGLPEFVREAAAAAACERGLAGRHVVTLSRSAVEPFLALSPRRDLRRRLYEAWTSRGAHPGEHDNTGLIGEILTLRAEQARLLGYANFADYRLDDSMAKTRMAARGLLEEVWEPAKRRVAEERAKLAAAASADGLNDQLRPWDWHYYAERVRKTEFDVDEAEAKPYFALDNIVQAAFAAAGRLFGLAFAERHDLPVYHPDVRVWEARGRDGQPLGLFLHDNFARPGKRSGAWMASYRVQRQLDGPVLPVIVNNNNFARGNPTLLSFDDVRTLFHEFGHGLHGLLSQVRYPSQSGTAVRRDFVEFPSQIFEHWAAAPELLREYAVHYRTGEPLPEDLLRRLLAARNFNQGFATVEYTAAALIDLELHSAPAPDAGFDPLDCERRFAERIGMPEEIGIRHRLPHFQHLFAGGGYAAGYYAYLWAEVLDADGFAAFTEKGNAFDPQLAARLERIYRAGDSEEPMALYRAFRGRDPEVAALLRQRGLAQTD